MKIKTIDGHEIEALQPEDFCLYCLDELRQGIPDNGKCEHREQTVTSEGK